MRTTLTLDDELARTLKELARARDQPFKQVVNETLRAGLTPGAPRTPYTTLPGWPLEPDAAFGQVETLRNLDGGINMNALAADLEDEELLRKLREGR